MPDWFVIDKSPINQSKISNCDQSTDMEKVSINIWENNTS